MENKTSNSEFTLQRRVQFTNEIPNVNFFNRIHNALNNSLWKWFLGWQKITRDCPYKLQDNLDQETFMKVVNGVVAEKYGPTPSLTWDPKEKKFVPKNPKFHKMEINGVALPEFDLLLHEIYRYLGHVYPDHPDYAELLTNNELNDEFKQIASFIDYDLDTQIFELVNSNDTKGEVFDSKEALKYKVRDLLSEVERRKFAGSNTSFRAIASAIGYWGEIYPVVEYNPLYAIEVTPEEDPKGTYQDSEGRKFKLKYSDKQLNTLHPLYKQQVRLVDYYRTQFPSRKISEENLKIQVFQGYEDQIFEIPFKTVGVSSFENLDVSSVSLFSLTLNKFIILGSKVQRVERRVTTSPTKSEMGGEVGCCFKTSSINPVRFGKLKIYPSWEEILSKVSTLDEEQLTLLKDTYPYFEDEQIALHSGLFYRALPDLLRFLKLTKDSPEEEVTFDLFNRGLLHFSLSKTFEMYPTEVEYHIDPKGDIVYHQDTWVENKFPVQPNKFLSGCDLNVEELNIYPPYQVSMYKALSYTKGSFQLVYSREFKAEVLDQNKVYSLLIKNTDSKWALFFGKVEYKGSAEDLIKAVEFKITAIPKIIPQNILSILNQEDGNNYNLIFEKQTFKNSLGIDLDSEICKIRDDSSFMFLSPSIENSKLYWLDNTAIYARGRITKINFGGLNVCPIYENKQSSYRILGKFQHLVQKSQKIKDQKFNYFDVSEEYTKELSTHPTDWKFPIGSTTLEKLLTGDFDIKLSRNRLFEEFFRVQLTKDFENHPSQTVVLFEKEDFNRVLGLEEGCKVEGLGIDKDTRIIEINEAGEVVLSKEPFWEGETILKVYSKIPLSTKDSTKNFDLNNQFLEKGLNVNKGSVEENGLYGSKTWPNTSSFKPKSFPDFGHYFPLGNFSKVVLSTYPTKNIEPLNVVDSLNGNQKPYNKRVLPAVMLAKKRVFAEVVADKLLEKATAEGVAPSLMVSDILDYLNQSVTELSKTYEDVNCGVQLTMETDTTGFFSLTPNAQYTDPKIRSRFQTIDKLDRSVIPSYILLGNSGNLSQNFFKTPSSLDKPGLYGTKIYDESKTTFELDEYKGEKIKIKERSYYGNDQSTVKNLESSLLKSFDFKVQLGEHNVLLNVETEKSSTTLINFSICKTEIHNSQSLEKAIPLNSGKSYFENKNFLSSTKYSMVGMGEFIPSINQILPDSTFLTQENTFYYWIIPQDIDFVGKNGRCSYSKNSLLFYTPKKEFKQTVVVLGTLVRDLPSGLEDIETKIKEDWNSVPAEGTEAYVKSFKALWEESFINLSPAYSYLNFSLIEDFFDLKVVDSLHPFILCNLLGTEKEGEKEYQVFSVLESFYTDNISYKKPPTLPLGLWTDFIQSYNPAKNNLEKAIFKYSLPHQGISEGTLKCTLRINPELIGKGWVLKCTNSLKDIWEKESEELVYFCISQSEIKKDSRLNLFYQESYVYRKKPDGTFTKLSNKVKRIAIYFENPKYFKNLASLRGLLETKTVVNDQNQEEEKTIISQVENLDFDASLLQAGDIALSAQKVDIRNPYNLTNEATFFDSKVELTGSIRGFTKDNKIKIGPALDGSYRSKAFAFNSGIEKLKTLGNKNLIEDLQENIILEGIQVSSKSFTDVSPQDYKPSFVFFKNLLIFKARVDSENPDTLYPPLGSTALFEAATDLLRRGDILIDKASFQSLKEKYSTCKMLFKTGLGNQPLTSLEKVKIYGKYIVGGENYPNPAIYVCSDFTKNSSEVKFDQVLLRDFANDWDNLVEVKSIDFLVETQEVEIVFSTKENSVQSARIFKASLQDLSHWSESLVSRTISEKDLPQNKPLEESWEVEDLEIPTSFLNDFNVNQKTIEVLAATDNKNGVYLKMINNLLAIKNSKSDFGWILGLFPKDSSISKTYWESFALNDILVNRINTSLIHVAKEREQLLKTIFDFEQKVAKGNVSAQEIADFNTQYGKYGISQVHAFYIQLSEVINGFTNPKNELTWDEFKAKADETAKSVVYPNWKIVPFEGKRYLQFKQKTNGEIQPNIEQKYQWDDKTSSMVDAYYTFLADCTDYLFNSAEQIKYHTSFESISLLNKKALFIGKNGQVVVLNIDQVERKSQDKDYSTEKEDLWTVPFFRATTFNKKGEEPKNATVEVEVLGESQPVYFYAGDDDTSKAPTKVLMKVPTSHIEGTYKITTTAYIGGKYLLGGYFLSKEEVDSKLKSNPYIEGEGVDYGLNQHPYKHPFIAYSKDECGSFEVVDLLKRLDQHYSKDTSIKSFALKEGKIYAICKNLENQTGVVHTTFIAPVDFNNPKDWSLGSLQEEDFLNLPTDDFCMSDLRFPITDIGLTSSELNVVEANSQQIKLSSRILVDKDFKGMSDVLVAFNTVKDIPNQEVFVDTSTLLDFTDEYKNLKVRESIEVDSREKANKIYSPREISQTLKGYPALAEDISHEFYDYEKSIDDNGVKIYAAKNLINSAGNPVYLCDDKGYLLDTETKGKVSLLSSALSSQNFNFKNCPVPLYTSLLETSKKGLIIPDSQLTEIIKQSQPSINRLDLKNSMVSLETSCSGTLSKIAQYFVEKNLQYSWSEKDQYLRDQEQAGLPPSEIEMLEDADGNKWVYDKTNNFIAVKPNTFKCKGISKVKTNNFSATKLTNGLFNFDSKNRNKEVFDFDRVYIPPKGYGNKVGENRLTELPWEVDPIAFDLSKEAKTKEGTPVILANSEGSPKIFDDGLRSLKMSSYETLSFENVSSRKEGLNKISIKTEEGEEIDNLYFYKVPEEQYRLFSYFKNIHVICNNHTDFLEELIVLDSQDRIVPYEFIKKYFKFSSESDLVSTKVIFDDSTRKVFLAIPKDVSFDSSSFKTTPATVKMKWKDKTTDLVFDVFWYKAELSTETAYDTQLLTVESSIKDSSNYKVSLSVRPEKIEWLKLNKKDKQLEKKGSTVSVFFLTESLINCVQLKPVDYSFTFLYALRDTEIAEDTLEVFTSSDYKSDILTPTVDVLLNQKLLVSDIQDSKVRDQLIKKYKQLFGQTEVSVNLLEKPKKVLNNTACVFFDEQTLCINLANLSDCENKWRLEGLKGWRSLKLPKYENYYSLLEKEGVIIKNKYPKKNVKVQILDITQNSIILSEKIPFKEQDFIELKILSKNSINLSYSELQKEENYTEVSMEEWNIFTPDRVWFPSTFPHSPVLKDNQTFNLENYSFYERKQWRNANGKKVYECDEKGKYTTLKVENGVLTCKVLQDFSKEVRYNPLELKYKSKQEIFENQFYSSVNFGNPYWSFVEFTQTYDSATSSWDSKVVFKSQQKVGKELMLLETESLKYFGIFKNLKYNVENNLFNIHSDVLYLNTHQGILSFAVATLEEHKEFKTRDIFNLYGLYAENNFKNLKDLDCKISYSYILNSKKNFSNRWDKKAAITSVNEVGVFDQNHRLMAYGVFPPLEYNSDTQHLSFNLILNHTPHIIEQP